MGQSGIECGKIIEPETLSFIKRMLYRPSWPGFYKMLPHLLYLSLALRRFHFTYVKILERNIYENLIFPFGFPFSTRCRTKFALRHT